MATDQKKSAYPLGGNLRFMLSRLWRVKSRVVYVFLKGPVTVLASFLGVYLSSAVVAAVTQGQRPEKILWTIGTVSLALIAAAVGQQLLSAQIECGQMLFDFEFQILMLEKCVGSDYENIASPEGLGRMTRAMENSGSDDRAVRQLPGLVSSLTGNVIGIASYAALLAALSPWILLAVTATTLAGLGILKKTAAWEHENKRAWMGIDRRLDYLKQNAADFKRAKDIRLYGMADWFRDVFDDTLNARIGWHRKTQLVHLRANLLSVLLGMARDALSYGLLVWVLFARGLPASDFILYFGIIGGFASWLGNIVGDFDRIHRFHLGVSEIREFLDFPDRANHGPGAPPPRKTFSVEFRNVCYRYPGSETDTIKNLSFVIPAGQKLAVVGPNGAGKTTLVKLLCGLLTPTAGEILIDGRAVNAYNREEYYTLFAAVFQQMFVLPLTITENVSAGASDDTARERAAHALSLAGLDEKIKNLPQGMDTRLVKSVYDDAVDLSGGETQKLALARALYKNGRALVLDEPTAALDPIAESRVYEEYHRMTQGHTSVFISHRLASTRFCDRIFYIDGGQITQTGTHDALLAQGGKYADMYEIQSHYYREGAVQRDA